MTITREDLEYAAKAARYEVNEFDKAGNMWVYIPGEPANEDGERPIMLWKPGKDDGDCARMCGAVQIDTRFGRTFAVCEKDGGFSSCGWADDRGGDKMAAWRYASVKLAAAVGRAMP